MDNKISPEHQRLLELLKPGYTLYGLRNNISNKDYSLRVFCVAPAMKNHPVPEETRLVEITRDVATFIYGHMLKGGVRVTSDFNDAAAALEWIVTNVSRRLFPTIKNMALLPRYLPLE